jgi:YidC/Oxa1 family membrane protein insertase
MDRQATIGFVLIFVVLLAWMWMNAPAPKPQVAANKTTQVADTTRIPAPPKAAPVDTVAQRADQIGALFGARIHGTNRVITVETDLFRAELTAKGGLIKSWKMKSYKTWNGLPVELLVFSFQRRTARC